MTRPIKLAVALIATAVLPFVLAACGSTASTSSFKGEQHEVAQAFANLQSDARAAEEQKVCSNDLANAVVARLNASTGGCTAALKRQLPEIDNTDVTVESVQITTPRRSATARVKSTYNGKSSVRTVSLVYEAGKWKLLSVT